MTNEEKAYFAGIIDGEGSIMLLRFHNNQYPAPCVSIASTSLELLQWIKAKTGYGIIKAKKNYKPGKHVNSYTYTARYDNAIELLKLAGPYLVINQKKIRAEMIINNYKTLTRRNGRYTSGQIKAKEEFYNMFINV